MKSNPPHTIIGQHLLADLAEIKAEHLRDATATTDLLDQALRRAGFQVLDRILHRFSKGGAGFSAVILLSESHASLHTYPEHGWLAFDLFSCGQQDPQAVLDELAQALEAKILKQSLIARRLCPHSK
ncbi:MAG: adenosylmethionine decarboxylase [Planctomycetota bacterium]